MPEEIKKLLDCSKCNLKECIGCEITYTDRKKIREYIEQLNKGQHTLMQSRKKWKNRYYKERVKRKKLIEKLEEDIKILNSEERITPELVHKAVEAVYAQKLLAILKGEKEV